MALLSLGATMAYYYRLAGTPMELNATRNIETMRRTSLKLVKDRPSHRIYLSSEVQVFHASPTRRFCLHPRIQLQEQHQVFAISNKQKIQAQHGRPWGAEEGQR